MATSQTRKVELNAVLHNLVEALHIQVTAYQVGQPVVLLFLVHIGPPYFRKAATAA
jgi:hypothetical protein